MDSLPASRAAEPSGKLKKLLRQHTSLSVVRRGDKDRVVCAVTGHEMPCSVAAVQCYVSGKKYRRHVAGRPLPSACRVSSADATDGPADATDDASCHLVPSKKRRNQLFCQLTGRHVNNLPCHIQRHVEGKRFQRYLEKWKDCQEKGIEYKRCNATGSQLLKHSRSNGSADSASEGEASPQSDMEDLYPAGDF